MTQDEHKTKAELLQELNTLRCRISELEQAEREAAEYTLWNSEERYRSLLSNIPDIIWTTDCEGKTTFISPNVEELYGYNPEEIYRQGDRLWFGRIHPDDVEKVKEAYKTLFEKGTRFDIEYRIKRKDGKWIWLHDRSIATYEKDGVMYADGLFSDITERKKAEDALRESEEKWRSLAENAPDVILTVKPDGTILFLNRTVLPYTPEKAVGTSIYEYVPPEYQQTLRDALERVVRTGEPYSYELAGAGPDGRTSWYQSRLGPIKKGGQVVALTLIATDVTQRKKAEEVLRESEEKYRKLFEETTDAIFVADAETGVIIDCNRAASELVGREKSELIGKHQRTLHPPQEIEGGFSKTFKQHIEEKEGQVLEAQVITKMGEIKDVEIRASSFEQKSKKWIQGMFRDITERKKAEQALRESQSRQKAILDSIPDIAWLKDKEGKYIAANEALCKAFGIKIEDFVGKTDFDISPEDLAKRYRADDHEVMKSGERKRVEELWGKKEGERIWIETIKTPIFNDEGHVIGTSGIARDISERKKAEEQIAKLAKFPNENPNPVLRISKDCRILYANKASSVVLQTWAINKGQRLPEACCKRAKEAFSSGKVSTFEFECHDGRTFEVTLAPVIELGYVNAYGLDITKRKQAEKKLLEHEAQLRALASELSLAEERERRRIATELHDRISQYLVISKIKLDGLRHSVSPEDPGKVLEEVCGSLGQAIEDIRSLTFDLSSPILHELGFEAAVAAWLTDPIEQKHGVTTEFEDDGQDKPLDDDIRALLFRSVRELLLNVVKHAKANKVKVSIRRISSQISVSVEDDGVGFDATGTSSVTTRRGGFGLFSIRERLEELGGHLEIEAEPGHGCKVVMTAPIKHGEITNGKI